MGRQLGVAELQVGSTHGKIGRPLEPETTASYSYLPGMGSNNAEDKNMMAKIGSKMGSPKNMFLLYVFNVLS